MLLVCKTQFKDLLSSYNLISLRVCLATDIGRWGLAWRAAGRSAAGVHEGAQRAEERSLQPARPAGHQRRHHPPQPAGAQTG